MAYYLPNPLPLFLILSIFSYSTVAQTSGNMSVGASLTATDNTIPWLSPSQDFAFGFQKPNNNDDLFLLSIWFYKLADKTIVWYANEGRPVPRDSKVELTTNRGLVLTDPRNNQLWSSGTAPNNDVAYGLLNDTGNFVIVLSNSVKIWESFSNPTDTLLPTQIMEINGVLFSRQSETNFSHGRFQLRLLGDGNLMLNTREVVTNLPYSAYYSSGTNDASNTSNSGYQLIFAETGLIYVLRRNDQRFNLTPLTIPPPRDYYYRATLNFDGVFSQYYYRKNSNANQNWTSVLTLPNNICTDIRADKGRGACGYNNVCSLDQYDRPVCECPQSFSPLDPSDKYGSCKPNFTSCDVGGGDSINHPEDLYDFEELRDTDWPLSDYEQMSPYTEEDCKKSCLNDCFCAVAILRGDSCWKKKLPLSNGRRDRSVNGKAFIKFWKSDQTIPAGPRHPDLDNTNTKNEKQTTLILVGSVLLGSSFLVNIAFVGGLCLGRSQLIYHKKAIKIQRGDHNTVETNLRCFTYKELTEATNGFKEEVGRGAFGIVYKGAIDLGGSTNLVAVKKLDRMASENEKEFKTEVNVIGQTHHKNLVRLIGFCDERMHRMLVYEFFSNGTLANFLFGDIKPSWKERTQVAFGIARGLLYLHEECSKQIIHCDIKPQNILLDDYNNAHISDFGLAKLLNLNQSRTSTGIRGTKGYVAPEWFRNTPITVMVDVYSFGVLLLEIISCRRSLEGDSESPILIDWVCDCFQEGRLDVCVDNEKEALNDGNTLERFVMVGIWCIHKDPSLRPTMRRVTQMLEGVLEVDVPPCPCPFSTTV